MMCESSKKGKDRLVTIAGRLVDTGGLGAAEEEELGRLIDLYELPFSESRGWHPSFAALAGRYFEILGLVFASGQRHAALQRLGDASPYIPNSISVLVRSPYGAELLSFLRYIVEATNGEASLALRGRAGLDTSAPVAHA